MPDLVIFRSKRRIEQISGEVDPRYGRRLSDQITTAFYEACRIGNLDVAKQLVRSLEWETARSANLGTAVVREDGDDMAAVRARFALEVARREQPARTRATD